MIGNGAVSRPTSTRVDLRDDEMLVLVQRRRAQVCRRRRRSRGCLREHRAARAPMRGLVELRARNGSEDDATVLVVHREAAAPSARCATR